MKISSARSVGKWQGVFFWGVPLARHGLCIERTPLAADIDPDLNQPGALTGTARALGQFLNTKLDSAFPNPLPQTYVTIIEHTLNMTILSIFHYFPRKR